MLACKRNPPKLTYKFYKRHEKNSIDKYNRKLTTNTYSYLTLLHMYINWLLFLNSWNFISEFQGPFTDNSTNDEFNTRMYDIIYICHFPPTSGCLFWINNWYAYKYRDFLLQQNGRAAFQQACYWLQCLTTNILVRQAKHVRDIYLPIQANLGSRVYCRFALRNGHHPKYHR